MAVSAKKWIVMFIAVVVAVLGLCAAFNMAVDPFGVFGDRLFDWYSYNETNNPRVAKIAYLDEHHEQYDSYVIGSSSAASYNTEELNQYMNANFYNLFVYGCDTQDYCDFAEYLIDHYRVDNLILNLGINEANSFSTDKTTLNHCEHAKVSGENLAAFYLKYAFCNPKYSVEKIDSYLHDTVLPQTFDVFVPESGCYDKRVRDVEKIGDLEVYTQNYAQDFPAASGKSSLPNLDRCIESVAYIKDLCEENGVNLTVIFSPVYVSQWDSCTEEALRSYKTRMAEITDYWDFSYSSVSFDSRYFYDQTHFRNAVGSMILAKMFSSDDLYYPEDFGSFVTKENVDEHVDSLFQEVAAYQLESYTADVPILMYHHLDGTVGTSTVITPESFERQLCVLRDAGYHTVTLDDLRDYVYHGVDLPENPVCITFDDGYLSNYEIAYPILEKYGMKATIFAIGCSVGHTTYYKNTEYPITPHFGYEQAVEMMNSGLISVQSHTYDMHQWPPYESADQVRENISAFDGESDEDYITALTNDIVGYQEEFAAQTGYELTALAYPEGIYSTLSEVIVHRNGIDITLSTDSQCRNTIVKGLPQTLYALGRYNMSDSVSEQELLQYLQNH